MEHIEKLIQLNAELEGLLHVLAKRDTSDIRKILINKYADYTAEFEKMLGYLDLKEPDICVPEIEHEVHSVSQEEAKLQEAVSDEVEDEMEASTEAVEKEPEAHVHNYDDVMSVGAMSVDEMLSRKEAKDLKRVFTLNDKFRFRRALFNADDTEFAEALERLGDIESFDEAKEFLVTQYNFDTENPDVEDFLSIIKPHYLK